MLCSNTRSSLMSAFDGHFGSIVVFNESTLWVICTRTREKVVGVCKHHTLSGYISNR